MSMIGNFVAIAPDELERLIAEPSELDAFNEALIDPEHDHYDVLDVDKMWHAIHFVLNGTPDDSDGPLGLAVLGGEPFGPDIGYGPMRHLSPEQVQAVAVALEALRGWRFSSRFDLAALREAEIYPQIWDKESEDDLLDEILRHFERLVGYYNAAAARGDAMILFLN